MVSDLENSFCCCYGMKASSSLNGSLVSCIFPTDEGGKSDIFSKGKNVLLSPSSTIIYSFYTYFHHYIQSENKLCNIRCGTTVQAKPQRNSFVQLGREFCCHSNYETRTLCGPKWTP